MANLAQFLDQLKPPASPGSRGHRHHGSTSALRPLQTASMWQTLVLAGGLPGEASATHSGVPQARFDQRHRVTAEPSLLFQWREDFGWHRGSNDGGRPSSTVGDQSAREKPSGPAASPTGQANLHSVVAAGPTAAQGQDQLRELLAEAAHDIRSPIAVAQQILGMLWQRLQAGENLTASQCELLRQANLRLSQANQWAEGILLDQRLRHGQPISVRRRFYPHQWLTDIEPLMRSLADQRQIRLQWRGWDRSLPKLYLDPGHLSRIVLNLVTNALQASPPTSCVRIGVAWLTNTTQQLIITIEDEGGGLPPHLLRTVNSAAPWPTGSDDTIGSGLGLKTAKKLARGLGGSLTAQASHRGGTQFSLCIPVDSAHSLVRSWLKHNAEEASASDREQLLQISIHAVRGPDCKAPGEASDTGELNQQLDTQLQRAAAQGDLVYRVAADRWLWLSVAPEIAATAAPLAERLSTAAAPAPGPRQKFAAHAPQAATIPSMIPCRHQEVFRLGNVKFSDWLGTASSQHNLLSVTSMVAEKMTSLIGNRIPPVDDLEPTVASPLRWSALQPKKRQLRRDPAQGVRTPFSSFGNQSSPSLADSPCDSFSGTLAELAQQWHARQRQLDHLKSSLDLSGRIQYL